VGNVLFLAYHFPPIGGGGVQRNAKFARYLPEFGHVPIVVTGPGSSDDRWAPQDETLGEDVEGIEVHRVPGPEPHSNPREDALRSRLLLTPRTLQWWVREATKLAVEVGREREIDLVYASLVPYATAEAAVQIAAALGTPWVADLQDPWALDEMWLYPSAAHRALDRRRMRALLRGADAIVMNTPEAAVRLERAFPELVGRRVVSIPNGFDSADFAGPPPERDDGRFRIVHAGYLHTEQGLRLQATRRMRRLLGGIDPIDVLPRSHVYLLQALEQLVEEDPALRESVELVLAGVTTEVDREVAAGSSVQVTFTGYISHAESVAIMRSCDLLFLPMHELPAGRRAGLVPGKTYEYLAAERPILAAVPDGDARELLQAAGNALICRPSAVDELAAQLRGAIDRWRRGVAPPKPSRPVLAAYERRELTRQLAAVFDDVAAPSVSRRSAIARDLAV
jgi:glycosyltransferase involved in cell wall biosynthesis